MFDKPYLVVIDTRQIKSYVFGTRYLREVRGASLLLDRLNRTETRRLLPPDPATFDVIYLGGGSGRVLFADEETATNFAGRVAGLYRQQTANARLSIELIPRQEGESFPDWMARGVRRSRRNKWARSAAASTLIGGRWIRPCSSCGREPAATVRRDIQGTHQLCTSCFLKRREIRRFYRRPKHNWSVETPIPTYTALKNEWPDTVLESLAGAMEARFGVSSRVLLPQDFDQIGEKSRPRNYFGFIYADGNQMGKAIRAMALEFTAEEDAKAAYRAFSEIVDLATRESAVQAVIENVDLEDAETEKREPAKLVPAEFAMAGGDDLVLVLPAHAALPAAGRFIELFQQRTLELQERWIAEGRLPRPFAPEGLTTSAGVVLSHVSYPASQLLELARELMKLAKREAAELAGDRPVGTLDFMVIHESGSEGLIGRRRREYEAKPADEGAYFSDFMPAAGARVRRTERPYTPGGLSRLCARVRALRESAVPRGKLKRLYAALFQGFAEARFDALRIVERLAATGDLAKPVLAELVDELACFPFRKDRRGDWSTPLTEMIEIYDFVPGRTAEAPREGADA